MKRIRQHGQPWVFTPKDFLDLGTPHAVGMTLLRLVRDGSIRRLARGLYDCPKTHPVLGLLSPPVESIAKALAGRDGTRIQASGAYAANLLHLSEQVPAKIVYHTDGASRQVRAGSQTIILKNTAPSRLRAHDRMSGLVIQALRYLGKTHITEDRVKQLQKLLSPKDRRQLLKDLPSAPVWMHPHLRIIGVKESRRRAHLPNFPRKSALPNMSFFYDRPSAHDRHIVSSGGTASFPAP